MLKRSKEGHGAGKGNEQLKYFKIKEQFTLGEVRTGKSKGRW
jgi:hypothetical protein